MRILLAGATGLVGSRLLPLLLADGHEVVSLGRRACGVVHPGLQEIRTDFAAISPLGAADAAICALGTTMAKAGSQTAFRAVDEDAVLAFARAAYSAPCPHFLAVSAVGADPRSRAFYSRVKGEVEARLQTIGFARLDLLRPGLIIGPRAERRPIESIAQKLAPVLDLLLFGGLAKYGSIPAGDVALALASLARAEGQGVFIHHNPRMRRLSAT